MNTQGIINKDHENWRIVAITVNDEIIVHLLQGPKAPEETWIHRVMKGSILEFYRKHLKKFKAIRFIIVTFAEVFWSIQFSIIKKAQKYTLVKQIAHANLNKERVIVLPSYKAVNPRPPIFPTTATEAATTAKSYQYVAPEIYFSTVNDALIFGNTGMVIRGHAMIHNDSINFKKDIIFEEFRRYARLCANFKRVKWFLPTNPIADIPEAASFTDTASGNYAHWLSEVLPRIVLFCTHPKFKEIPLVLNANLPSTILESACIAAGPERVIYLLPDGHPLKIGRLHLVSSVGYAPAETRGKRSSEFKEGNFNGHALGLASQFMRVAAADFPQQGDRLYLRRQSKMRHLLNSDEIERTLVDQGFKCIDTGEMSFLEQVAAMAGAKMIVAPGGAALANIMFCQPGTTVTVLAARNQAISYFYWENMARPFGVNIRFVLSEASHHHIHTDFEINPHTLLDALNASRNVASSSYTSLR